MHPALRKARIVVLCAAAFCAVLALPSPQLSARGINCTDTLGVYTKNSPAERFQSAYCKITIGDYTAALEELKGLDKKLPLVDEYVHYYMGVAAKKNGNLEDAKAHFERALKLAPSKGLRNRVLAKLAETHFNLKDYPAALSAYRELYAGDTSSSSRAEALMRQAEALNALGRYAQALTKWKTLWTNHPESELSEEALRMARKVSAERNLSFRATPIDYRKRAERLFRNRLWERAYRNYLRSPATAGAKLKMAICKYKLKDYGEASRLLAKLQSPKAMWWLSNVKLKLDKDKEAIRLLSSIRLIFPQSRKAPDGLFRAARLAEIESDYPLARKLFGEMTEQYPRMKLASDARWHLGWMYYKEGRFDRAQRVFSALKTPKAKYWRARALEKLGKKDEARTLFTSLAKSRRPSYYSYLAQEKTGIKPDLPQAELKGAVITAEPKDNPRKKSALFFIELGLFENAVWELDEIELYSLTTSEAEEMVTLYGMAQESYPSIKLASKLGSDGGLEFAYPRGAKDLVRHFANLNGVDEYQIYSIIREESRFQTKAVSPQGAIGLMQIMPETGKKAARKRGINDFSRTLLFTPETNLMLGTAYFKNLLDEFGGEAVYAIASYNGGPHNVAKWMKQFQDLDVDEFVEEIPFKETRNYVKKVLKSYGVYRAIYESSAYAM